MTLSLDGLLKHEFARQQRTLLLEDWVIRVVADEKKLVTHPPRNIQKTITAIPTIRTFLATD